MSDVLIIGYGPAGVSASLYALRSGLDVVMVGKDSGALEKAHMIENYYGLEKPLAGSELFAVGKRQAEALGAKMVDDEITDLFFDGNWAEEVFFWYAGQEEAEVTAEVMMSIRETNE